MPAWRIALRTVSWYAPESGVVAVRAGRENGSIVVRVIDRGPGVPAEDRERIFRTTLDRLTARVDRGGR